jgi:hypothetical protein
MLLTPPSAGEPVEELWQYVRDAILLLNALANAEVQGPGLTGKVIATTDHAKIVIETDVVN